MQNFTARFKKETALAILLFLAAWQTASLFYPDIILPGPLKVAGALLNILKQHDVWLQIGTTVLRGLGGFCLAFFTGLSLGLLAGMSKKAEAFFRPWVVVCRSTPLIAITLLAVFWLKPTEIPFFVTFLVVFPVVEGNVAEGIKGVDAKWLEMAKVFKVNQWRQWTRLYLPAITPQISAGVLTGLGLAWRAVLTAEVLAYPKYGIGTRMNEAKIFLKTEELLAWTVLVLGISFCFDWLLRQALRKKIFSKKENYGHSITKN